VEEGGCKVQERNKEGRRRRRTIVPVKVTTKGRISYE
jgi:hypothetical protein